MKCEIYWGLQQLNFCIKQQTRMKKNSRSLKWQGGYGSSSIMRECTAFFCQHKPKANQHHRSERESDFRITEISPNWPWLKSAVRNLLIVIFSNIITVPGRTRDLPTLMFTKIPEGLSCLLELSVSCVCVCTHTKIQPIVSRVSNILFFFYLWTFRSLYGGFAQLCVCVCVFCGFVKHQFISLYSNFASLHIGFVL